MVPADAVGFTMLQRQLESLLDSLSEREAGVIRMRFGLGDGQPKTLDQIGDTFGVTRERIRQIESKTMAKLRHPSPLAVAAGLPRVSEANAGKALTVSGRRLVVRSHPDPHPGRDARATTSTGSSREYAAGRRARGRPAVRDREDRRDHAGPLVPRRRHQAPQAARSSSRSTSPARPYGIGLGMPETMEMAACASAARSASCSRPRCRPSPSCSARKGDFYRIAGDKAPGDRRPDVAARSLRTTRRSCSARSVRAKSLSTSRLLLGGAPRSRWSTSTTSAATSSAPRLDKAGGEAPRRDPQGQPARSGPPVDAARHRARGRPDRRSNRERVCSPAPEYAAFAFRSVGLSRWPRGSAACGRCGCLVTARLVLVDAGAPVALDEHGPSRVTTMSQPTYWICGTTRATRSTNALTSSIIGSWKSAIAKRRCRGGRLCTCRVRVVPGAEHGVPVLVEHRVEAAERHLVAHRAAPELLRHRQDVRRSRRRRRR